MLDYVTCFIDPKFSPDEGSVVSQALEKILDRLVKTGDKTGWPAFWVGQRSSKFKENSYVQVIKNDDDSVSLSIRAVRHLNDDAEREIIAYQQDMVTFLLFGELRGAAIANKRNAPEIGHNMEIKFGSAAEMVLAVNALFPKQEDKIEIPSSLLSQQR
jgi:hypothetical protein